VSTTSDATSRLTVGQALVRFLAAQYSERDGVKRRLIPSAWAILGHGNVAGLGQALQELGPAVGLPTYRPQNEQAMVHAAAAFAKHSNRLATQACTASVGPGSLNMLTAAAGATINRVPVLLLPGDLFANRRPDPVLQQLEHPSEHDLSVNDAFRPVSRFFTRIWRPEQLLAALPEAMRVLTDPAETGAVTISLPQDVQAEAYEWPAALFAERVWRVTRRVPDAASVDELAHLLRASERPLIVAGGGVIYSAAGAALALCAERLGVPVAETQAGKGSLRWDHPYNVGPVGSTGSSAANELARTADLVIAIGTRLSDFTTASMSAFQRPGVRFVGVNVSAFDAHKLGALAVVGDARVTLEALLRHESAATSQAYRSELTRLRAEWDATVTRLREPDRSQGDAGISQAEVIGVVNAACGPRSTVINAAGSMPGDLVKLWRAEDQKAYHVEYGFSCMGYEIPAGIGVKLADPERHVVVLIGDGSYLMLNSEIVTAVAEGIDLTVVLVDNNGYQSINALQTSLGTPSFVNELRFRDATSGQLDGAYVPVDFVAHARALGADAVAAHDAEELAAALAAAKEHGGVNVVVVHTPLTNRVPGFGSWWDVPVAAVAATHSVVRSRDEYEQRVTTVREHRFGPYRDQSEEQE
jgi:3D-(3,5/4)-trihydroxycyclohexane-1,2-dione acylhydrolase (decyclizing)